MVAELTDRIADATAANMGPLEDLGFTFDHDIIIREAKKGPLLGFRQVSQDSNKVNCLTTVANTPDAAAGFKKIFAAAKFRGKPVPEGFIRDFLEILVAAAPATQDQPYTLVAVQDEWHVAPVTIPDVPMSDETKAGQRSYLPDWCNPLRTNGGRLVSSPVRVPTSASVHPRIAPLMLPRFWLCPSTEYGRREIRLPSIR
jgi:hypothetical protein